MATAARAGVAAAVYVSPEVYSLPVYQEFASLRPPLGDRTRLVIIIKLYSLTHVTHKGAWLRSLRHTSTP